METLNTLQGMASHTYSPKKLVLDLKNRPSPPVELSIEEPPVLELKKLSDHMRYIFLGESYTLPKIVAADLNIEQVQSLVKVLKRFNKAISLTISDIIGIPLDICTHKI